MIRLALFIDMYVLGVFFIYIFLLYCKFLYLYLYFYFLLVTAPLNRVTWNHGAI